MGLRLRSGASEYLFNLVLLMAGVDRSFLYVEPNCTYGTGVEGLRRTSNLITNSSISVVMHLHLILRTSSSSGWMIQATVECYRETCRQAPAQDSSFPDQASLLRDH